MYIQKKLVFSFLFLIVLVAVFVCTTLFKGCCCFCFFSEHLILKQTDVFTGMLAGFPFVIGLFLIKVYDVHMNACIPENLPKWPRHARDLAGEQHGNNKRAGRLFPPSYMWTVGCIQEAVHDLG